MKKRFTKLLTALALLVFMMPSMVAWGQTNDYTIGFKDTGTSSDGTTARTSKGDIISSGDSYVSSLDNCAKVYNASTGNGVKLGASGGVGGFTMNLSTDGQKQATKITIKAKQYSSTEKDVKITINGSTSTIINCNSSMAEYDWTLSSATDLTSIRIESNTKRVYVHSIKITYSTGGDPQATPTTTTIDASGITNTDVYVSTVAGSLSATVTPEGGAALVNPSITWSSSNTGVATIESNGTVTLVAAGNTTITASYAGVANEYAASSATYALTVTSSAPDYATLPFNWAGGVKSELTAQMGVSAYGLGSDYAAGNAPYRVKFDDTSDYIQIKTDSKPGVVGIGVKMLGGGTSSKITVIASSDGSSFDAGEELTISGTQDDVVNLTSTRDFSNDVRYIRLVFTKGSNVGVGPISISKEQYNVTCASVSNGSISSGKTKASAGETVTLTATPSTHYTFSSWSVYKTGDAGTTVTVWDNKFTMPAYAVTVSATFTEMTKHNIAIPANVTVNAANNQAYCGDVVTITVTPPSGQYLTSLTVTGSSSVSISPAVSSAVSEYTFTMPDENVTIAATFGGHYTVRFSVNGEIDHQETVSIGNSTTLPGSATEPDDFDFEGWTEGGGVNVLAPSSSYTPTSDITLYAVYSRTEQELQPFYVLVESDLGANNWAGDYLIAYSSTKFADGRVGGTATDGIGAEGVSVNPGSNLDGKEIAATWGDTYNVTLEAITDGYVMVTKDGKYNYQTSNSNGLSSTNNLSTADDYPISVTYTSSSDIKLKNSSGAGFRFNNSGSGFFRFYKDCGQSAVYLYRRQYVSKNVTKYYTQVLEENFTATAPMTITTPVLIQNGQVFNMNGNALTNGDAANLIIEDGGQLIVNNSGVKATVKKTVAGYGGSRGVNGWNFIASPISGSISPTTVTNMINGTAESYDLYRLNMSGTPGKEWENYKQSGNHYQFDLVNGMGYLYANADGVNLSFSGDIQPSNVNKDVTGLVAGDFNLVGNPYTCDAYLNQPYFTIKDAEDGITNSTEATLSSVKIPSCTGVIVKTDAETTSVTFSTSAPDASANSGNLQMVLAQNVATRGEGTAQTLDKAIVSFNEGSQLGKFYFGTQDANLYIPQDNEEYAIVSSSAQGEMPVNFKAYRDGQYTLTVNPEEVEMGYLHLIDNIAGTDVDLLANPSYTFNAKADDYESRFRLVFSANMVNADLNDDFAFFSNGQLVIANEGEAILQVIDVTGRVVATESVNGTCSKAVNVKAGIYVLRLINGTNVKTQKIIVK